MADEVTSTLSDHHGKLFSDQIFDSVIIVSPFSSTILKLDDENFLIRKLQILPILRRHKLDKFVLCQEPEFLREFVAADKEVAKNTMVLYNVDQQIYILQGWLISTITVSELSDLVGFHTSRRIWTTKEIYAPQSEVSVSQLRNQLQTMKKGNMKIIEFCKKMKKISFCFRKGSFSLVWDVSMRPCLLISLVVLLCPVYGR